MFENLMQGKEIVSVIEFWMKMPVLAHLWRLGSHVELHPMVLP